jgi:hypothetical protein
LKEINAALVVWEGLLTGRCMHARREVALTRQSPQPTMVYVIVDFRRGTDRIGFANP